MTYKLAFSSDFEKYYFFFDDFQKHFSLLDIILPAVVEAGWMD
jgi:hypothetical protein